MEPLPFDPKTCVTAGALRSKGIAVTSDIPDHAWIFKSDVELIENRVPSDDGEPLFSLDVKFNGPFVWDAKHDQVRALDS